MPRFINSLLNGELILTPQSDISQNDLEKYDTVMKMTAQLNQMEYDAVYIDDTLIDEKTRLKDVQVKSKQSVYKVQQLSLQEIYSAQYYKFVTNIIIFTCFVSSLCLTLGALIRNKHLHHIVGTIIIAITLCVYTIILLLCFNTISTRSNLDWEQLYFRPSRAIFDAK
jgi:hypothetical protein